MFTAAPVNVPSEKPGVAVGVIFVITETVPGDVTRFAPHLTTLLVLAFASQRLRMPAANGKIYRRGEGH